MLSSLFLMWLAAKWLAMQLVVVGWMIVTVICPGLGQEEMDSTG